MKTKKISEIDLGTLDAVQGGYSFSIQIEETQVAGAQYGAVTQYATRREELYAASRRPQAAELNRSRLWRAKQARSSQSASRVSYSAASTGGGSCCCCCCC